MPWYLGAPPPSPRRPSRASSSRSPATLVRITTSPRFPRNWSVRFWRTCNEHDSGRHRQGLPQARRPEHAVPADHRHRAGHGCRVRVAGPLQRPTAHHTRPLVRRRPRRGCRPRTGGPGSARRARRAIRTAAELLPLGQHRPRCTADRSRRHRVRRRRRPPRHRRRDHRADRGGQLRRPGRRARAPPRGRRTTRGRRRRRRFRLAQAHHRAATRLRQGRPRPDRRHRHGRDQGGSGRSARDVHLAARRVVGRRGHRDHCRTRPHPVATRAARPGLRNRLSDSP